MKAGNKDNLHLFLELVCIFLEQFPDIFEDSSPTKFYIVFILGKFKECPCFDHKMK